MIEKIGFIFNWLAVLGALLLLLPLCTLLFKSDKLLHFSSIVAAIFQKILFAIAHTVMWAGLLMMIVQVMSVVMRYVFGINFIWMQESITYLFGAMFLLAGGYVLIVDEHVRVDIFYTNATPKRKALIDLIGTYLFLVPVCGLIIWAAGAYVSTSWIDLERSQDPSGIHAVFLLKSLIPAFAVLLAMGGFVVASRSATLLLQQEGN